ncbi:MAG: putative DNA-binding transcriptional regulator AlpA [Cycloclasticus pugetii]|jgi:predicted DNA-binding transcriptional regulator AlpA|uniref:helix-turn-helix transcriptional regulator n=1 Tax=Cycloclasticus pugetii TaxID=34068 RepID=UPI0039E4B901
MLSNKKFVSVTTLAAWYDVTKATIWRWSKEGVLPSPIKIMGSTRWSVAKLNEWESKLGK